MARKLFSSSLTPSSPLPSPYSHSFPSVPSLFYLLLLLPFPFLSISAYTRTLSPTSPALSLPSPAYSISTSFYPYPSYLPIPAPSTSLFPFRPQTILSPPSTLILSIYICLYPYLLSHQPRSFPSAPSLFYLLHLLPLLFLSTYTHSLLPLASLFTPVPCLFPLPSPSDERDEGYPILLMGRRGGAGDSHIPLTPPRGKSEGRDRNKIPEATYPLWGTSPRVDLWGRVRTWGNGGYFFAFFIPSR